MKGARRASVAQKPYFSDAAHAISERRRLPSTPFGISVGLALSAPKHDEPVVYQLRQGTTPLGTSAD
jgi:hypothetical protein